MSPRFVLGRENVPCVAEVVNRSLKADCTDFTTYQGSNLPETINQIYNIRRQYQISPQDTQLTEIDCIQNVVGPWALVSHQYF